MNGGICCEIIIFVITMDYRLIGRELKNVLQHDLGDRVEDVILFGSQLKDTAGIHSDIDVVIVLNTAYDEATRRRINQLCYQIDLKYDIYLDTLIISTDELNYGLRGKHPLFENAIKEGYYV